MKISVEKIKDWDLVYKTALYTQGKKPLQQFPSEKWKHKTVIAQHSPIRQLEFLVVIEDVPNKILNHLSRHVHSQPYIRTMREDITNIPDDEITRNTPNNGCYVINAQEFIQISHDRLCCKASKETREVWQNVVYAMRDVDPLVANMCVPHCIYCGYCKEYKACGYNKNTQARMDYLFFISGREND